MDNVSDKSYSLKKKGVAAMTGSEIKEKLICNSLIGVTRRGYQVTWFLRNDGVIIGVNGTGANRDARDSGVWEITQSGDFLCSGRSGEKERKVAPRFTWLKMN